MATEEPKEATTTRQEGAGDEAEDEVDEETKKQLAELSDRLGGVLSTSDGGGLKSELDNEVDASTRNLMMRVRRSIAIVKKETPNIRLQAEANAGEMKTVDVDSLLGIIKDTQLKMEVQKAVKSSEKMVRDISNLLSSEGFL